MPSQLDFDVPPLYDLLLNQKMAFQMSDIWIAYWSSFYQILISYLSQNGIFLPQLTTDERNALQNLVNGQMIYNTTADAPQFWQASSSTWRTYLFV